MKKLFLVIALLFTITSINAQTFNLKASQVFIKNNNTGISERNPSNINMILTTYSDGYAELKFDTGIQWVMKQYESSGRTYFAYNAVSNGEKYLIKFHFYGTYISLGILEIYYSDYTFIYTIFADK